MFLVSKKTIIGGALGNALEAYDYVVWGLFSVYLSNEFLPPQSQLSDIFFLFLITYILRPIGGIVGGILADQLGRKRVLTLSIFIMGICTSIIGILPSYNNIGVIAVFLLLFVRLMQMFSMGSEYISSIALLIESCDKKSRGYFGSWVAFGFNAGVLVASLAGSLVLHLIDKQILPSWGWRLVFILSLITALMGVWVRYSLPESLEFILANARTEKRTFADIIHETIHVIKSQVAESFLVFFVVLFGVSTTVLIFIYAPIHMTTVNHLLMKQSFIINSCGLFLLVSLIPLFGFLSDIFGRVRMMIFSTATIVFMVLPYFIFLSSGLFMQVLIGHMMIAIPCACLFAITPVLITEIFSTSIRCSVTSLLYSVSSCLGGGITPLVALKLSKNTANSYQPAFMLIMLGIISLLFLMAFMKKNNITHRMALVFD